MNDSNQPIVDVQELEQAIARLPRLEREAFRMAARDRLSYPAIAKRLRIPRRRVARLIARALVRLDRALKQLER